MKPIRCALGIHWERSGFELTHSEGIGTIEVTVCLRCLKITDYTFPPGADD